MLKYTSLYLIFLFTAISVFAQKQPQYYDAYQPVKRTTVGLTVGPTVFHGDADQTKMGFSGGLFMKYSVSPSIGFKFSGNFGKMSGTRNADKFSLSLFGNSWDRKTLGDSYEFSNNFWDLDATFHLILGNMSYVRKPRPTHFYIFAGFGLMGSNSKGSWKDPNDIMNPFRYKNKDTTLTYKGVNARGPVGVGLTKKISDKLDLGIEYRFNYTRKDLLDAFSFDNHANRTFDSYSNLGINVGYKLGKTENTQHMDWISPTNEMIEDKSTEVNDSDGDGVADKFDIEPGTPKGALVYGNGVAVDSDQDGVPDYRDDEPLSSCNKVDGKGVMYDGDADGVPDCKDEEANTPSGSLVDRNGRKIDISKSSSSSAACCNCTEIMLPSVFVDEDNEFRPEAYSSLYLIGSKMQQCPDVTVDIIGYYGMNKSSEQSARSKSNVVIEYLVNNYGLPRSKFNVQTKPETMGGKYSKQRIDVKVKK